LSTRIVIIGGGAAGASAAAKARRHSEETEIVMITRDNYITSANCGLPYYISGKVEQRKELFRFNPYSFQNRYQVKVLEGREVYKLEPEAQRIYMRDQEGKEESLDYGRLILATGASAAVPPIFKGENKLCFSLRRVTDADRIREYVQQNNPSSAVIVGAGILGLEMIEALLEYDIKVTIIGRNKKLVKLLDEDIAAILAQQLETKGVQVITGDAVRSYREHQDSCLVETQSGKTIQADFVLLAAGVRPNVSLAKECGLELGSTGAIKVDKRMQTNIANIFAAGDCAETVNLVSGQPI
jgi:NADPH-dependent 2,4-dienoyl-CoA reductase/sulfur reductase-like enzyme